MTLCLCAVTVLFSWIAWRLGYEGFLIVGHVYLPVWAEMVLATIFFHVGAFVLISIALNLYDRRIIKYVVPFVILEIPVGIFLYNGVSSFVLMLLYPFVCLVIRRDFKGIARLAFASLVIMAIQALSALTAIGDIRLGYNDLLIYNHLVLQIDMVIFLGLFYSIMGVIHYGTNTKPTSVEHLLFPEDIETPTLDEDDRKEIAEFNKLTGLVRLKAVALLLSFQIAQWALILFIGRLGNVFIEILVISTSFVLHGFIIKRRWHSPSLIICTLSSAAMFYVSARAMPPFQYTQLLPIVTGVILLYALYRVAVYQENIIAERKINADIAQARTATICALEARINDADRFSLDTATEAQITQLCASVGVFGRNKDFAVACFVKHKSCKELWAMFGDITTSEHGAEQKRRRLRRKLQKQLETIS